MATKKSGRVKVPRRIWRRDRPQVRATPGYTDEIFERIFGHKHELNVMDGADKQAEQEVKRHGKNRTQTDD